MKKIFVPFLYSKETCINTGDGRTALYVSDALVAYPSLEEAEEAGKKMVVSDPKAKVIILEAMRVVEAREVKFTVKQYNTNGELLV